MRFVSAGASAAALRKRSVASVLAAIVSRDDCILR